MANGAAQFFAPERPLTREEQFTARVLAVQELHGYGWSLREIGREMGISHEWVRKLLRYKVETSVN